MLHQFKQHINVQFPFLYQKKLIVATSGGVDSMVLVHLLHELQCSLVLAHCNFRLRGTESDMEEDFVINYAKVLKQNVYTQRFDTATYATQQGISIQMAARDLRYRWFASLIKTLQYDYVLTAHHADDMIETFFINLSRGTGIEGLTGIPAQNKHIIRPLLPFSKTTIKNYAKENKINWCEDSSNMTTKYLRNALRHRIIPQLNAVHPGFSENIKKTFGYLSGSRQLIEQHIKAYKEALFEKEENGYKISVSALKKLHPQRPYLYELFKDFGFTEWNDVAHMLYAPSGKQLFSAAFRLVKDREHLYIVPVHKNASFAEYSIDEHTKSITNPMTISFREVENITDTSARVLYVDKEKLKFPLTVRKWKKGDYFYPFGMQGKKKLSKFFKDEKYSLLAKESQWLLCSNNTIVWIIGKRADQRYKVATETQKILKISLIQ